MQLNEFPEAIAHKQSKVLHMKKDLRMFEESHKTLVATIRGKVAADSSLKNETTRKAAEAELMQSDKDLQITQRALMELKDAIGQEEIALELLLNQFAVCKIEARERTAAMMAQAV